MRLVLDRKIFYAILLGIMTLVLLFPVPIPLNISDDVQATYDALETTLNPGDVVYVNMGCNPTHWFDGSGFPPIVAVVNHLFALECDVIFVSAFGRPQSPEYVARLMRKDLGLIKGIDALVYGEDYVSLPSVAGGEAGLIAWLNDIWTVTPNDYYATPMSDLPMMADVRSIQDIDFVVVFGYSVQDPESMMRQVQAKYGIPVLIVVPDSFAPGLRPYVTSGQAIGMLHGARKGAEYELLVGKAGQGLASMGQFTLCVAFYLILVIIANVTSPLAAGKTR
jgi:hypothetical protein